MRSFTHFPLAFLACVANIALAIPVPTKNVLMMDVPLPSLAKEILLNGRSYFLSEVLESNPATGTTTYSLKRDTRIAKRYETGATHPQATQNKISWTADLKLAQAAHGADVVDGGESAVVGDPSGKVSTWLIVPRPGGGSSKQQPKPPPPRTQPAKKQQLRNNAQGPPRPIAESSNPRQRPNQQAPATAPSQTDMKINVAKRSYQLTTEIDSNQVRTRYLMTNPNMVAMRFSTHSFNSKLSVEAAKAYNAELAAAHKSHPVPGTVFAGSSRISGEGDTYTWIIVNGVAFEDTSIFLTKKKASAESCIAHLRDVARPQVRDKLIEAHGHSKQANLDPQRQHTLWDAEGRNLLMFTQVTKLDSIGGPQYAVLADKLVDELAQNPGQAQPPQFIQGNGVLALPELAGLLALKHYPDSLCTK